MKKPPKHFRSRWIAVAAGVFGSCLLFGCAVRPPQAAPPNADGIDAVRMRAGRAFQDSGPATDAAPNPDSLDRQWQEDAASNVATAVTRGTAPPDWLGNASEDFPTRRYLTAIGRGDDRREAEDRARAEIARFFHSDIEFSRRTHQAIRERSGPGGFESDQRTHSAERLQVSSRKILAGVWIARVHAMEPTAGGVFALAVLDRRQAAAMLTAKIRRLDGEIQAAGTALEKSRDRWEQVRILQDCLERLDRRAALTEELNLLQPNHTVAATAASRGELQSRLDRLLQEELQVAVAVTGPGSRQVDRALTAALTKKGYAVAEQRSQARLLARGAVNFESEAVTDSPWKFVRWQVHIELVDCSDQHVVASLSDSGREGHLTYDRARQRALQAIDVRLAGDIADRIDAVIRGNRR